MNFEDILNLQAKNIYTNIHASDSTLWLIKMPQNKYMYTI